MQNPITRRAFMRVGVAASVTAALVRTGWSQQPAKPVRLGFIGVGDRGTSLLTHTDVFASGTEGYHTYRIPAIEAAPDGALIAFAEGRKYNADDPGFGKQDIDLVYRRSTNNGATWSPLKVLEDPGELWSSANSCRATTAGTRTNWLNWPTAVSSWTSGKTPDRIAGWPKAVTAG
jgi:hypothetical protein